MLCTPIPDSAEQTNKTSQTIRIHSEATQLTKKRHNPTQNNITQHYTRQHTRPRHITCNRSLKTRIQHNGKDLSGPSGPERPTHGPEGPMWARRAHPWAQRAHMGPKGPWALARLAPARGATSAGARATFHQPGQLGQPQVGRIQETYI